MIYSSCNNASKEKQFSVEIIMRSNVRRKVQKIVLCDSQKRRRTYPTMIDKTIWVPELKSVLLHGFQFNEIVSYFNFGAVLGYSRSFSARFKFDFRTVMISDRLGHLSETNEVKPGSTNNLM
jgi:hypothetical protein